MRAVRLHAPRIDDLPSPLAGGGELVLRVTDVGRCGSDLHYFSDGHIGESVPSSPLKVIVHRS